MAIYNGKEFTEQQMRMILLGSNHGLNVNSFAKPYYSSEKMSNIISVLTGKTNRYNGVEFSDEQIELIKDGLENELDVDIYANPDFSPEKMEMIMLIMISESSVDLQHLGEFSLNQLKLIAQGVEDGLKVHLYANPDLSDAQMEQVYLGVVSDVDIYKYNNSEFSCEKMRLIRVCLENGVDVTDYLDYQDDIYLYAASIGIESHCNKDYLDYSKFTSLQILELVTGCKEGINVESWAKPDIPEYEMYQRRCHVKSHSNLDSYISKFEEFFKTCCENDKSLQNDIKEKLKNSSEVMRNYATKFYELCLIKNSQGMTEETFIKDVRHLKRSLGLSKLNPVVKFGKYNSNQLSLLFKVFYNGWDLGAYAKPDYNVNQLQFMFDNNNLVDLIHKSYDLSQLDMLKRYKNNIEIFKILVNKDLSSKHMEILYKDLQEGLNIEAYAKPDISMDKVKFLSLSQRYGYNNKDYLDFSDDQYQILIRGLLHRVNIKWYSNPELSLDEMEIIEDALAKRINVGVILSKGVTDEALCELMVVSEDKKIDESELDAIKMDIFKQNAKPEEIHKEVIRPKIKARKKVYARKVRNGGKRHA